MSSNITNAVLAQKINELIGFWQVRQNQFHAWIGGEVGGGPNLDGRYPLTDYLGVTRLTLAPAQLEDDVEGSVGEAANSALAASVSEAIASSSAIDAAASGAAALASENAAIAARDAALGHRNAAENAATTAIAQAQIAVTNAADSALDAGLASDAADAADASATAAAVSAAEAAASAVLAATFDPADFYTKTAADALFALLGHDHAGVYSPVAHDHDASYAPLSHSHAWGDLTGFPTTIELGHASDTTLARIAAGRVSIEGGEIAKLNGGQPFTAAQVFDPNGNNPVIIGRSGNGANEKLWGFQNLSTPAFQLAALSDAFATGQPVLYAHRSGSNVPNVDLFANGAVVLETRHHGTAPATTGVLVRHADGVLYDAGLNVMPPITRAASATFARADVGKTVVFTTGSNTTQTLPASADTTIPVGALINLYASSAGNVTIAQGSGITLSRPNGTGAAASGNRVLSQGGFASLWKFSSTVWIIWGNAGLD